MVTTYRHRHRCSRYGTSTCYFAFTPHESSLHSPLQFTEEETELREVESCVQDHTASRAGMLVCSALKPQGFLWPQGLAPDSETRLPELFEAQCQPCLFLAL